MNCMRTMSHFNNCFMDIFLIIFWRDYVEVILERRMIYVMPSLRPRVVTAIRRLRYFSGFVSSGQHYWFARRRRKKKTTVTQEA